VLAAQLALMNATEIRVMNRLWHLTLRRASEQINSNRRNVALINANREISARTLTLKLHLPGARANVLAFMELGHQAHAAAALSVVPGRHGDGGDAAGQRRWGQRCERDGGALDWSGRAGLGWIEPGQVAHSARTRLAHVESNVAPDSGSAVIKMLSDPVLRNLLQPAPKLVVLCKNYQNRY
jgi:hypothetical protein